MPEWKKTEQNTAEDLVRIIRILRDPVEGCPWDKVQTHQSIRKNFLEEVYEALEAIDAENPEMLREELGDVLMQVVFHAVLEEERGSFAFSDVCRDVCEKLIFRHPHIFGAGQNEDGTIKSWDELKNEEKGRRSLADELDTVPVTLPALMRVQKLQKRASRYGVGSNDLETANARLTNVTGRWTELQKQDVSEEEKQALAGELLGAVVNAVRLEGIDAEEALTLWAKRFPQKVL